MFNITKLTVLFVFLLSANAALASEQTALMTLEKEGFIFEFQKCQLTSNHNSAMVCDFLVENSNPTKKSLAFYPGKSQFVDSDGNVVTSSAIQIGNNASNSSKVISDELIQGIPLKGSVIFGQAPQGNIRLINLFCSIAETVDRNHFEDFLGKPVDLTLYPDEFNVEFRF